MPQYGAVQRKTRQRTAIVEALARAGWPLTAAEVLEQAREAHPRTGPATVYRALAELRSTGALACVALPGDPVRYAPAEKKHRHYFRCDRCRRVFEIEACPGAAIDRAPKGFRVRGHEVILYGICGECAPRRAVRTPGRRPVRRAARRRAR